MSEINQVKINDAFECWLRLNEDEQAAFGAQVRGYEICRSDMAMKQMLKIEVPAPPKRGRKPRKALGQSMSNIPGNGAETPLPFGRGHEPPPHKVKEA